MIDRKNSADTMNYSIRMKKVLVSTVLVGSLMIAGNVSANDFPINQRDIVYDDYQDDKYWSEDMLWAIDRNLIGGYIDQGHPTTKEHGNWINPYGDLTEAQMLTVLFRYKIPDEFQDTAPQADWWASVQYQLADKYIIPTNGSLDARDSANETVTRGLLAQALTTLQYGEQVSMEQSVQFMYDSGLSTGYADESGNKPKNFASYGVDDPLKRSHIATFMKTYHDSVDEVEDLEDEEVKLELPVNDGEVDGEEHDGEFAAPIITR